MQPATDRSDPFSAWVFLALTILALLPILFGVMIALGSGEPPWQPYAWRAWTVVAVCSLAGLAAVVAASRILRGKRSSTRGVLPVCFCVIAAACPALARAALPWEQPGTGTGSPLAVLLSMACMAIPAAGVLVAAGFTVVRINRHQRGLQQGVDPSI